MRHSSELINILERENYKPVLITVSDGDLDHRISFPSEASMFCAFDLNIYANNITLYLPLTHSWTNLAESYVNSKFDLKPCCFS